MILMYRLLRELSFQGLSLLLPLAVFCLHPYMIFLAGSINNDMLSILFMLLTMLYTLRWSQKPCFKNIVILALSIGLGMSTKLSVAYLAPATALVFLWKLLHTPDHVWQPRTAIFRFWKDKVLRSWRKFSMGKNKFRLYVGAANTKWLYSQALALIYKHRCPAAALRRYY